MKTWHKVSLGLLGALLAGIVVVIIYAVGIYYLPEQVLSSYQSGDCSSVLKNNHTIENLYPPFLRIFPVSPQIIGECGIYIVANSEWELGKWQQAYSRNKEYLEKFPSGKFIRDAREKAAESLLNIASEQANTGNFATAIDNLLKVTIEYNGTPAATRAKEQIPQSYLEWAAAFQKKGDFQQADETLTSLYIFTEGIGDVVASDQAVRTRADLFLQQSISLLAQKQFEQAINMAEKSIALAPNITDETHPAFKSRLMVPQIYINWADELSTRGDTSGAEALYQKALLLADPQERLKIEERIFRGRLSVIDALTRREDFIGALKMLSELQNSPQGLNFKAAIEQQQAEISKTFSNSTGNQAQTAMEDAAQAICNEKKTAYDIFGMGSGSKISLHGIPDEVKANFPVEMTSSSPAEMHYVVCIEEKREVIQTIAAPVFIKYQYVYEYIGLKTMNRTQITWEVWVYHAEDANLIVKEVIKGPPPPAFGFTVQTMRGNSFIYVDANNQNVLQTIEGERPPMEKFVEWLKNKIQ